MKAFIKTFLAAIIICGASATQAQVTFFKGTWDELFAKAKSENKPVMVFLKLQTCGYCKYTESQIFNRDTAYEYLNEHYICYEIDLKTPQGRKLKQEHEITLTPTFLFYNAKGKFMRITEGFVCAKELRDEAMKANKKLNLNFGK